MQISVIIPVYNAERFIKSAIESVLMQPEVAEVLLVDDGSHDGSVEICREFLDDKRVKLLHQPNRANQGVSATRNLGIASATMPFIAFLDADDTYLPDRFAKTRDLFGQHPDANGVYETIGVSYLDATAITQHLQRISNAITGISKPTTPEQLFRTLATGKSGHIHLNGLTLKRNCVTKDFLFDPKFVMSEDMDLILRLAAKCTLYGGQPDRLVALRGVHETNSVFVNPNTRQFRYRYLRKCIDHHFYGSTDLIAALYIVSRCVGAMQWYRPFRKMGLLAFPIKLVGVAGYMLLRPRIVLDLFRML